MRRDGPHEDVHARRCTLASTCQAIATTKHKAQRHNSHSTDILTRQLWPFVGFLNVTSINCWVFLSDMLTWSIEHRVLSVVQDDFIVMLMPLLLNSCVLFPTSLPMRVLFMFISSKQDETTF